MAQRDILPIVSFCDPERYAERGPVGVGERLYPDASRLE